MSTCKRFRTYKERGEWVELRFMAAAMGQELMISKPWGDSAAYDVGVEYRGAISRVQIKSTSRAMASGYRCGVGASSTRPYTLALVDFFAAYVIGKDLWYLVPASVVLLTNGPVTLGLAPSGASNPRRYEDFREAWDLLKGAAGEQAWLGKALEQHGSIARLPRPAREFAEALILRGRGAPVTSSILAAACKTA